MDEIQRIQNIINQSLNKFEKSIPITERRIYRELVLLLKELSTDKNGNIKPTIANIRKVSSISRKLEKIIFSKQYVKDVSVFVQSFYRVSSAQNTYFGLKPNKFLQNVQQLSIDTVIQNLTESGMSSHIIEPIRNTLVQNVSAGGSYSEIAEYLETQLRPKDSKGLFAKYVNTIATDSINTFSRTYNVLMSEQAGYEWFIYNNTLIETSREFCVHMVDKRYFHKSEIPVLLTGNIDGHQCKIYKATGLPYGMKEDTNESTFPMYAGGWNCGHQIVGVPEDVVPEDIKKLYS